MLGSRVLVWLAGLTALAIFGKNAFNVAAFDPAHLTEPFRSSLVNDLFAPAARWDSQWYLAIAQHGYISRASSAFFPLYPLLIRGGTEVLGSAILVGALISLGSLMLALVIVYRLAALDLGEREARLTVLLIAFFPTAFFFSAVYSEALYLALSVGAIYAARLDRWAWAGLLAGLAAATRSSGILLALPIMILYLYGPRAGGQPGSPTSWWKPRYRPTGSILWLGLVPLGIIIYMDYLTLQHIAPLTPFQAENEYWQRQFAGPFGAAWDAIKALPGDIRAVWSGSSRAWNRGDPLTVADDRLIDVGFLGFAVVGLIASWRRVPFAYFAYAIALLAEGLSYPAPLDPLESFPRYVLVMFPIFMGWGALLAGRRRLAIGVVGLLALLLGVFSGLWAMWVWVA